MPTKNSTKTVYAKPVSARFKLTIVKRLEACAEVLTKKRQHTHHKANVLEICVNNHLPKMERELGIKAAKKGIKAVKK